jgi:oligo-1,6-glucosidase
MQWDSTKNAGFSTNPDVKPWMRVMVSYAEGLNVADQEKDKNSTLNFYRTLLKIRKEYKDLLVAGLFELHDKENENTIIYTKTALDKSRTALVVLNFTAEKQPFEVPASLAGKEGNLILSSLGNDGKAKELEAYEALIYVY